MTVASDARGPFHDGTRPLCVANSSRVGRSVARQFDVRAFRVRGARGHPALDGTLRIRDGTIFLSLTDGGERPLREGRGLFEARVGSRIWLVLSDDGGVSEFGILDDGED
jgi:hypothetical protein